MHNPTATEIQDVLHDIGEQVCLAIEKHPDFIAGTATAPTILLEELGEACQAINDGDIQDAVTELRQAACVIVRWIHSIEQGSVQATPCRNSRLTTGGAVCRRTGATHA